ncbi:NUDIX hydrolase [Clostridiaceae bacterium HFYG-1003]|nr:NUDIX hydrolase [Clostridiaceae bacterium HFYG-1003]
MDRLSSWMSEDNALKAWKTEKSELLINTPWVKVQKDSVRLANGSAIDDFYAITIHDAAAVVAIDPEGNLILKTEYRYCSDRDLIEIPAGIVEENETDGLSAARRELLEETGYASDEWQYLGATIESSAKLTNYLHLYLATNCRKVSEQTLDATEEMDVLLVPLEQAVDMVMKNEIWCNSSAHGILRAARMLGV